MNPGCSDLVQEMILGSPRNAMVLGSKVKVRAIRRGFSLCSV